MVKGKVFGQRVCTYCGTNKMYYSEIEDGSEIVVFGCCEKCGNEDYCDNETKEDVQKRFGEKLKTPDINTIYYR